MGRDNWSWWIQVYTPWQTRQEHPTGRLGHQGGVCSFPRHHLVSSTAPSFSTLLLPGSSALLHGSAQRPQDPSNGDALFLQGAESKEGQPPTPTHFPIFPSSWWGTAASLCIRSYRKGEFVSFDYRRQAAFAISPLRPYSGFGCLSVAKKGTLELHWIGAWHLLRAGGRGWGSALDFDKACQINCLQ